MRETAHQLAESARALGADDSHYTVWYAKQKWYAYNQDVQLLQKQLAEAQAAEKAAQQKGSPKGKFKITFYCPCATCNGNSHGITASGAPLSVGTSIAVDPAVIPLGSKVYIEGIGFRTAQDTGSAIKGNRIDVLVGSHSEAYDRGVATREVYVK